MFGGYRYTIGIVLGLVLCGCCAPTSAALNMSALCLMVPNGVYVASETDCSSYYQCEGSVANLQTCGSGQYFDKNAQQCVASSQSSCNRGNTVPCDGQAIGSFVSVNNSCSEYWYCGASGAQRGSCPSGQNFNPNKVACVWKGQYACSMTTGSDGVSSVSINLCDLIEDGIFFGSSESCKSWNYCFNNTMRSGDCDNNLVFNVQKGICDYLVDTSCSQVTHDESLSTTATQCTTAGERKNATACNQYYECSTSGIYILETCTQQGYYYDTVSQTCVTRMSARNSCDRCLGTTKTFVNAYSTTNCTDYLYCINGVQQGVEHQCPTGYYFNEDTGDCFTGADPDFACCNPSASN